jgi:hypothetical protein
MRKTAATFVFASLPFAAIVCGTGPAGAVTSCEILASLTLPYTTITAAQSVTP